jgi:ubiquinone/menaquinone biosynthesis C-methylase UbiE
MSAPDTRGIAASFDRRAITYAHSDWHRSAAERLVELCRPRPGDRLLDAATGTGFAAWAAARAVRPGGLVVGVDLSAGMLREAGNAIAASGLSTIELVQGDVTSLPQFAAGSFDVVTCASGLLYMPVDSALREWHRLLRPGGTVAFSEMAAGSPPAAQVFRDLAATFGLTLVDPCAALGSADAARGALEAAGFEVTTIAVEPVTFSTRDFEHAWEANFRSPGHAPVLQLPDAERSAFRSRYLDALRRLEREAPHRLTESHIIFAVGRKPL